MVQELQIKKIAFTVFPHTTGSTFLTGFDVLVQTSDTNGANKPQSNDIEVTFTSGVKETIKMTGLPDQGQAKLFSFDLIPNQQFYSISDVDQIAVIATSTIGWKIQTIVTTFTDNEGNTYSGSIDSNVNHWIQLDNQHPEYESFVLKRSSCY